MNKNKASISYDDDMQKAFVIQRATLLCIFFRSFRGWYNGAPLKY